MSGVNEDRIHFGYLSNTFRICKEFDTKYGS